MSTSIAVFLPSLDIGGAEKAMANLTQGFADRGLDTSLILARAKGAFLDDVSSKIRTIDLASGRVLSSLLPLTRYLRAQRPDVMLSATDHANVVALLARRWARVDTRVIVTVHKMPSQPRRLDTVGMRESLLPFFASRVYPWADEVIAVSIAAAAELAASRGLPPGAIKVIPNPVVGEKLFRLADEDAHHPWVPSEIPLILGVGRLSPEKDFATLIRAFERVADMRPCRLLILGEGPQRESLAAMASAGKLEGRLELPGAVENPYPFMSQASVFVLPSRWESFGIALIEAMACGTPVVATRSKGGVAGIDCCTKADFRERVRFQMRRRYASTLSQFE